MARFLQVGNMTALAFAAAPTAAWSAHLDLRYDHHATHGTRLRHRHQGPLRVFKSLYPQGRECCHTVLIHPPGGLVGGDELAVHAELSEDAHALISTPGATRFYASDGPIARQSVQLKLAPGSRLEWCPLESIAYPGCRASNHWYAQLSPGAELMAWDIVALGLPSTGAPFTHGAYRQHMAIEGLWLERAQLNADDHLLMDGQLGLAGHRAMATLCWFSGSALSPARQQRLLEAARERLERDLASAPPADQVPLKLAITCPNRHGLVLRGLAAQTEPLMHALQSVWAEWRAQAWGLSADAPRIWRV